MRTLADVLLSTSQLQTTPTARARSKVRSARSQNRAAAWSYDLSAWREYRLAMARSDTERQAVEQEYAERLEQGPDFCSYRVGSGFDEPPLHQLDAGDRC